MVEVESFYNGYDSNWNWGTKSRKLKLSNRCHSRLTREAAEHFDGFGLDLRQYGDPVVTLGDDIVAQVEWTHKTSSRKLTLLNVYFDKKSGEILQCGMNFGDLVS